MRRFILYSPTAQTKVPIKDLKSSGRIDILLHSIISSLFTSNNFREDTILDIILGGPPNSPIHIKICYEEGNTISKKDLKKLIELSIRKCKDKNEVRVHPGVYTDKKNIEDLVNEISELTTKIYFLDSYGKHIKQLSSSQLENGVFILGDHEGFDKQKRKYLRKNVERLSLGETTYFTSQSITIINYELDNLTN